MGQYAGVDLYHPLIPTLDEGEAPTSTNVNGSLEPLADNGVYAHNRIAEINANEASMAARVTTLEGHTGSMRLVAVAPIVVAAAYGNLASQSGTVFGTPDLSNYNLISLLAVAGDIIEIEGTQNLGLSTIVNPLNDHQGELRIESQEGAGGWNEEPGARERIKKSAGGPAEIWQPTALAARHVMASGTLGAPEQLSFRLTMALNVAGESAGLTLYSPLIYVVRQWRPNT